MSKFYQGLRVNNVCRVIVVEADGIGKLLRPRNDLWNHSPDGFQWGYCGSGPAQLSLALLADATGDDTLAVGLHQDYKFAWVARIHSDEWVLPVGDVLSWVAQQAAEEPTVKLDLPERN